MAEYLASIFGTEKDKVNCSFYFKIGACRHGDKCSRVHNRPTFSQTILLQNLYTPPTLIDSNDGSGAQRKYVLGLPDGTSKTMTEVEMQEFFDEFYEEVFTECEDKYGEIEEMNVCENLGDHLIGNVYVKFKKEEDAEKAVRDINNRWFNARPVHAELTPVTDFREACCRQYEIGECTRGDFCNFMHLKPISRELKRRLVSRSGHSKHRSKSRSRSRSKGRKSRSPHEKPRRTSRSRSRDRHRHHDSKRDKDKKERDRPKDNSKPPEQLVPPGAPSQMDMKPDSFGYGST
jgi:splicing factor U2AF subunit